MAASHRLDDAWASFTYFLWHELPADQMTAVQVETLRRMMALFRHLYASSIDAVAQPSAPTTTKPPLDATVARLWLQTWRKRLQFLADCDVVFQKYAQRLDAFPTAKIADVVQRHLPDDQVRPSVRSLGGSRPLTRRPLCLQIRWRGCGIPINGAASAAATSSSSSSSFRSMFAALQGTDDPNGSSRDVAGYSCGLWMMFHAFSIVGEQNVPLPLPLTLTTAASNGSASAAAVFTAQDVRTVVHDFVGQFFRCLSCRSHFLHSYDQCFFHHCRALPPSPSATGATATTAAAEDFAVLQLWLFQLHNLVANRIVLEKDAYLHQPLSNDDIARVLTAKLWPTRQQCAACYLHRDFSLSLETFRQKVARRRDFAAQQQQQPQPNSTATVTSGKTEAGHLRGQRDERWLRFASEEDVEWFLLHLVEHAFARDAVLRFLREAYRFP